MYQVKGKEKQRKVIATLLVVLILTMATVTSYIAYVEYRNGTGNFDFCGEKFTKCEMANLLYTHNTPLNMINDWVCLVNHESHFRTNLVARHPAHGKLCYGLFQISGGSWCGVESPGGGCNVTCEAILRDVDISMACAKKIYKQYGFPAWQEWVDNCKDRKGQFDYTHCIKRSFNISTA